MVAAGGCGQSTESGFDQTGQQRVITPTTSGSTDQATDGADVTFWVVNAPRGEKMPGQSGVQFGPEGQYPSTVNGFDDSGMAFAEGRAGYLQVTHIAVTTGDSTPTGGTGAATGSGSGAFNPAQTGTQTPTQTVTPEISGSVPVGVALPGGLVDQNATATGRGTSTAEKTSTNSITMAQLKQLADENPALAKQIIDTLFGGQTQGDAGSGASGSGDSGGGSQ